MRDVISIDGPAGSGKTTLARSLGAALGAAVLETGVLYRALALAVRQGGVDPTDRAAVARVVGATPLELLDGAVLIRGVDVTGLLRGPEVTDLVGIVAADPQARRVVTTLIRAWADRDGLCVVEGRDIGSVVFPDARLKIYLTADPAVRAVREAASMGPNGLPRPDQLEERDSRDQTRLDSPLVATSDMVVVDTTYRTADEVLAYVLELLGRP